MDSTIVIALITLAGTIISGVVGIASANRVISVKIDELSKRVDKHNSVIERTYNLETRMAVVEEKIDK